MQEFGGLLELGGDAVMLAPEAWAQISFRGINLWLCYFRSRKDLSGVGVMKEGREKEKENKKNEFCGHKSNWLIQSDFHF